MGSIKKEKAQVKGSNAAQAAAFSPAGLENKAPLGAQSAKVAGPGDNKEPLWFPGWARAVFLFPGTLIEQQWGMEEENPRNQEGEK